jgi:hypothetical protein
LISFAAKVLNFAKTPETGGDCSRGHDWMAGFAFLPEKILHQNLILQNG